MKKKILSVLNKFYIMEPNKKKLIKCDIFKFVISVRGDHFDFSLVTSKNLATPLFTVWSKVGGGRREML
jgi:hypothetical protein